MNALAITDINNAIELDNAAVAAVKGSGMWHLKSSSVVTGNWGAYQQLSSVQQGITFHDGYLSRHYVEGWKRQRTQTEYSTWDKFVKIY